MNLQLEIEKLNKLVSELRSIIQVQSIKIQDLEHEVANLKAENKDLKENLHKKNSTNSSIPPSKDENRPKRNQTLRRSRGKKSGGQKGHPGDTLKMIQSPDVIIKHTPSYCRKCGKELDQLPVFEQKRQVIDIPPIKPITTEHRVYSRMCQCGYCTKSDFPKQSKAPVNYGNNIEALISYLNVRQYLSINRIQEFFNQVVNLEISQGSICNKLKSFSDKCLAVYQDIKNRIEQSHCVGADETGFVLNGKKGWMWTWQSPALTYIVASNNRGTKTITDNFKYGFPLSTLVHDCWKPHFNIPAKNHQLCIAHLRRELNYFIEQRNECWSYEFEKLLRKALNLKKKINQLPIHNYQQCVQQIQKCAEKLYHTKIKPSHKNLISFQKRIIKYKDYLFPFLEDQNIPPDNNGSERAIRNVKVKQKVSGQFKTIDGANQFAIIRSVMDTCIKNNADVFSTLASIHILIPE